MNLDRTTCDACAAVLEPRAAASVVLHGRATGDGELAETAPARWLCRACCDVDDAPRAKGRP